MKSVSFSDLSKSFEFQMSETESNVDINDKSGSLDKYSRMNGESVQLERSSSRNSLNMKNLTHYTSSDDILKKFSSTKYSYDKYKNGNSPKNDNDSSNFNDTENPAKQQNEEVPRSYDKNQFIQDLKDQVKLKDATISKLQDDLVQEKNRYDRLRENCKIQENRIQYLEHMVSAFSTDNNNNNNSNNKFNEGVLNENKKIFENSEEKENKYDSHNTPLERNSHVSHTNNYHSNPYNQDISHENSSPVTNDFSQQFKQNFTNSNNDTSNNGRYISNSNDMKYRPNSADGSLYLSNTVNSPMISGTNKKWLDGPNDNQPYGHTTIGYRMNQSDSEDYENPKRYSSQYDNRNDLPRRQGSPTKDFISRHRQKLDRDRSMNLADFKSKLEEFSKIAQKTTERNTISSSSNHHTGYSQYNKGNSSQNTYSTDSKRYHSNGNLNDASRPPLHPHHKMASPIKKTYTNGTTVPHSSKYQHQNYPCLEMSKEDERLKERVKQILEKNNYSAPSNSFNSYNNHNSVPVLPASPTKQLHYDSAYQLYNDEPIYYGGHQHDRNGTGIIEQPSTIPKLDLTRRSDFSNELDPETSSLLDKYLNSSNYH